MESAMFQARKHFKITLLHPSRNRALKAKSTLDYWLSQSSKQISIEHILDFIIDVINGKDAEKESQHLFGLLDKLLSSNYTKSRLDM